MFSGIIQGSGIINHLESDQGLLRYQVELPSDLSHNLKLGASISINGVCQTVTVINNRTVQFEAIPETLEKTTLCQLQMGQLVHVERSLRYGDEIGGHLLSGHICTTGEVCKIEHNGLETILRVQLPDKWAPYLIPKGFIAIDGASLTLVDVDKAIFSVHLIPHTLEVTHFSELKIGQKLNIEIDPQTLLIVKTVLEAQKKAV